MGQVTLQIHESVLVPMPMHPSQDDCQPTIWQTTVIGALGRIAECADAAAVCGLLALRDNGVQIKFAKCMSSRQYEDS